MNAGQHHTVIIGAGLGGLTLALALHRHSIPCEIYELREPSYQHGGAIMLSPNALRILDSLGIWDVAKHHGYSFETLAFLTNDGDVTSRYYFGSEPKYGYPGFRIYRNQLVQILSKAAEDRGIHVHYGRRFSHVVSESDKDVSFAFADGSTMIAPCLIGADGTHSKVRKFLNPNLSPSFSGALGITTAIPYSKLRLPGAAFSLPASIANPHGAFVLAPQNPTGSEVFIGRQFFVSDRDRQGWVHLALDQTQLKSMLQSHKDDWSDVVQSAMEAVEEGNINIWPFHTLPPMDSWNSKKGRVITIGDAAHAIPPTAGQGANQAFEDGFTLAWLLHKAAGKGGPAPEELKVWYDYRQSRITSVMELNRKMGNMRLPLVEQEALQDFDPGFGSADKMAWLFGPDLEVEMKRLFAEGAGRECALGWWLWR